MREQLKLRDHYDLVVIGGGVHGAAVAWEASLTGVKVCLLEQGDFGAGVSANSLKIIHGGLRYLQHLDLNRTRAYAREQERLLSWFPHLIQPLPCVIPTYRDWRKGRLVMGMGVRLYELLAGQRSLPAGGVFSRVQAKQAMPNVWRDTMTGSARWFDAQVYNAERLVLSYALSARASGADVNNYMRVQSVREVNGALKLDVNDQLNGDTYIVAAGRVVNAGASGEVCDDEMKTRPCVRAVNLVIKRPFADTAVGVQLQGQEQFDDGRLLFVTPWRGATLVGTWYFSDRPEPLITRDELKTCFRDLSVAVPGAQWVEEELGLVHVGRLPVDGRGRLLERPRVFQSKRWPQLMNLVGVKYSNARLVAQDMIERMYGRPRVERKVYGGQFRDLSQYQAKLEDRLGPVTDANSLSRMWHNYGTICDQILPADQDRAPTPLGRSDIFMEEVDHACDHESAHTLSDVLIRRTGLGGLMPPDEDVVDVCARRLAKRYNWDGSRIQKERDDLFNYYQRIVDK